MSRMLLIERTSVVAPATNKSLVESTGRPGYLVESDGGKLIVQLPVTTLDQKNENGRTYGRVIMEGACRSAQKAMQERKLTCSVDGHPDEPYVEPGNASHIVTEAWCEGGYLWNKWEVLGTAKGRDLAALIEAGISFGVSIRGLGSCDNYGNVLEDYEYLGTDAVGNPSAKIWTKPEVVTNSSTPAAYRESVNSPTTKPRGNPMSMKRFIAEQTILLKNESDHASRLSRIADVEQSLSEAATSGKLNLIEAAQLLNDWNAVKTEVMAESQKDPSLEAALAENRKLKEHVRALTEAFGNKLKDQRRKLEVVSNGLSESLRKSQRKSAVLEAREKRAKAVTESLRKANDALKGKLSEAARRVARAELSTAIAIQEGAAIVRATIQESAQVVKESRQVKAAPAKTTVVESAPRKKSSVIEGRTAYGEKVGHDRRPTRRDEPSVI